MSERGREREDRVSKRGKKRRLLLSKEINLERNENEIFWDEEILKEIVELIILVEL